MKQLDHYHSITLGVQKSGKSTLNQILCAQLTRAGIYTMVLDPLLSRRWHANLVTNDPEKFLAEADRRLRCQLFVDESTRSLGRNNVEMNRLTTDMGHRGHTTHVMCQLWTQVDPALRENCERVILFRLDVGSAEYVARKTTEERMLLSTSLPKLRFIWWEPFEILRWGDVDPVGLDFSLKDWKRQRPCPLSKS